MHLINNKKLKQLRHSCIQRKIPIISTATEDFLNNILDQKKPKTILELGTAVGYSTIFFASKIKKQNGIIYSFERSYPSYLEAKYNIKKHDILNAKVYPFNINKINFKDFLPGEIDFFFIDAQKSQYRNYMMKIQESYGIKTTIVIDDVIKFKSKLHGLYEYLQEKQINYKILQLESDDGILLINPK